MTRITMITQSRFPMQSSGCQAHATDAPPCHPERSEGPGRECGPVHTPRSLATLGMTWGGYSPSFGSTVAAAVSSADAAAYAGISVAVAGTHFSITSRV